MSRLLLLVGTRKGAFVLEADGDRDGFSVLTHSLEGWEVSDLRYDPRDGGRLLAGVGRFMAEPGVRRSADLGGAWAAATNPPAYPDGPDREVERVWTVVPGRADEPGTLYAGVDEAGLFVSRDGGDSWDEVAGLNDHPTRGEWVPGTGGLCLHSILLDPADPDRMWVGISAVGVFRTDDGGGTWALCNDGLEVIVPGEADEPVGSCVHRVVLDPADPDRLYQQNHLGVYRSTDGADSWERVDDGLPSSFGFPIVMHPRDASTLYTFPLESDGHRVAIDGRPAVYRTTDAGESWARLDDGLPGRAWVTVLRQAMAVDDRDPAGIYFGTTGGEVFTSRDAGDSWGRIDCRLPRITSLEAVTIE